MDRQVPEHVDVVLKESEIDADRVVVVQATETALVDQVFDPAHRIRVDEGVVDHQYEIASLGFLDQVDGVLGARRDRLGDQHMFARL